MTVPPSNVLIEYNMTGQLLTPPYQSVYWTVYNTPDYTGAQSGYFGQLQNIAIASQYNIGSPTSNTNTPSGPAGGDLSGSYPNPIVVGVNGVPLDRTVPPQSGWVLTYNVDGYVTWEPAPGSGSGSAAGGDLSGTYPNPKVVAIDGYAIRGTLAEQQSLVVNAGSMVPLSQRIIYNVQSFGATGNAVQVSDGAISVSSHTLACTTSKPFSPGDVGKLITVYGAGAAGAQFITKITGYVSASTVTLESAAQTGVASGAEVTFGTDDLAAINAAITAAKISPYSATVYFPPGVYCMSAGIHLDNSSNGSGLRFEGANAGGEGQTNLSSRLILMTAQAYLIQITSYRNWWEQIWFDGNFLADNVIDFEYFTVEQHFEMCTFSGAVPLTGNVHRYGIINGGFEIDFVSFHRCSLVNDISRASRYALAIVSNINANAFFIKYDSCEFRYGHYIFFYTQGSCDVYDSQVFAWSGECIHVAGYCQPCTFQKIYNEQDVLPFLNMVALSVGGTVTQTENAYVTMRDIQMNNTCQWATQHTMGLSMINCVLSGNVFSNPALGTTYGALFGNARITSVNTTFANGAGWVLLGGTASQQLIDEVGTSYSFFPQTTVSDGAISSGSHLLVCSTSNPFTAQSIGQQVTVAAAGAGGINLYSTIVSYSSASTVTLNDAASGTVSGASVTFGIPTRSGSHQVGQYEMVHNAGYDTNAILGASNCPVYPGSPIIAADVHVVGGLSANRAYTISTNGVVNFGQRIRVTCEGNGSGNVVTVADWKGDLTTIGAAGTPSSGFCSWAEFEYLPSSGWSCVRKGHADEFVPGNDLVAWYKAGSSMAPAAWTDSSGHAYTLTQATGANQPTINFSDAAFNSQNTFSYLAASQQFQKTATLNLVQPNTYYFVGSVGANGAIFTWLDGTVTRQVFRTTAGNLWEMYAGSLLDSIGGPTVNSSFIACLVFNGASSAMYVNHYQSTAASGNAGAGGIDAINLGGNATNCLTGKMAEVLVYSTAHDQTNRLRIMKYLSLKYNIALAV